MGKVLGSLLAGLLSLQICHAQEAPTLHLPSLRADDGHLTFQTSIRDIGGETAINFWPAAENTWPRPRVSSTESEREAVTLWRDSLGLELIYRKLLISLLLEDRDILNFHSAFFGDTVERHESLPDDLKEALHSNFPAQAPFEEFHATYVSPLSTPPRPTALEEKDLQSEIWPYLLTAIEVVKNDLMIEMTNVTKEETEAALELGHEHPWVNVCGNDNESSEPFPPMSERRKEAFLRARARQNTAIRTMIELATGWVTQEERPVMVPMANLHLELFQHPEIPLSLIELNSERIPRGYQTNLAKLLVAIALDDLASQSGNDNKPIFDLQELEPPDGAPSLFCVDWDTLPVDQLSDQAYADMKTVIVDALDEARLINAHAIESLCDLTDLSGWESFSNVQRDSRGSRDPVEAEPDDPIAVVKKFSLLAPLFNIPEFDKHVRRFLPLSDERLARAKTHLESIAAQQEAELKAQGTRLRFVTTGLAIGGALALVSRAYVALLCIEAANVVLAYVHLFPRTSRVHDLMFLVQAMYLEVRDDPLFQIEDSKLLEFVYLEREAYYEFVSVCFISGSTTIGVVGLSGFRLFRMLWRMRPSPSKTRVAVDMPSLNHGVLRVWDLLGSKFHAIQTQVKDFETWKHVFRHADFQPGGAIGRPQPGSSVSELGARIEATASSRQASQELGKIIRETEISVAEIRKIVKTQIDRVKIEKDLALRHVGELRRRGAPDEQVRIASMDHERLEADYTRLNRELKHAEWIREGLSEVDALRTGVSPGFSYNQEDRLVQLFETRVLRRMTRAWGIGRPLRHARVWVKRKTKLKTIPLEELRGLPIYARIRGKMSNMIRDYFNHRPPPQMVTDDRGRSVPAWQVPPPPGTPAHIRAGWATRRMITGQTLWTRGQAPIIPRRLQAYIERHGEQSPILRGLSRITQRDWDRTAYDIFNRIHHGEVDVDNHLISKWVLQSGTLGLPANTLGDLVGRGFDADWTEIAINVTATTIVSLPKMATTMSNMTLLRGMSHNMNANAPVNMLASFLVNTLKVGPDDVLTPECWREITHRINVQSTYQATVANLKQWGFQAFRGALENFFGAKNVRYATVISPIWAGADKASGMALKTFLTKNPFGVLPIEAQGKCKEAMELFGDIHIEDPNQPSEIARIMEDMAGAPWATPEIAEQFLRQEGLL